MSIRGVRLLAMLARNPVIIITSESSVRRERILVQYTYPVAFLSLRKDNKAIILVSFSSCRIYYNLLISKVLCFAFDAAIMRDIYT